ncbi:ISL3 family transposase [Luteipulveratus halotolerans]|uniref:Transposase n=1 Tax=Luteipulveratus halotolerans TaxID=1631356 RepID=A0A0L6CFZ2_9MICO|nr:ISL3 family transposase [Luteipulveratus halotolerans]KNX35980.1 transposase [Luteipulveratus halotolerans]KNX36092.1 transposase [Luteipulveratus halotolerans]KNX36188.1 transposase [Luteipulveratus halotolerans]KNX36722.1 transposase [Luteipulveratus halotolerans]
MFKATADVDPATTLFNLPGYRVLSVTRDAGGTRQVLIEAGVVEAACPGCGVLTSRVHQRTVQRVRDVPFDGPVEVLWSKRRWRCAERLCPRTTFTEHTEQVPPRARLTTRLKERLVAALSGEVRAVDRVGAEYGVTWPTVMRQLTAAHAARAAAEQFRPRPVASLGIDEHRFRTVRWFRDEAGAWKRIEPWMTTFTDLATGQVLGVVDGRDSAAVKTWLRTRPRWWRHRVRTVAIDPSAAFRSAVRSWLPKARVAVDHFHLVKLANDALTKVRRRVSWDRHERRGRGTDLAWAHRLLLLRGYDTLSNRARERLNAVLAQDDPAQEISAAWGVKEQLRRVLAASSIADASAERATFNQYVSWAAMPETTRLKKTIDTWWAAIKVFIQTRATNARTEAANVTIKNIKRAGRGYRSHTNYQCRIMLYNAARSAA